MQPREFIARVEDDLAAHPDTTAAATARATWEALPLEQQLALADAMPECGHALAEIRSALGHLEREVVALVERHRAA